MKNLKKYLRLLFLVIGIPALLMACDQNEPDDSPFVEEDPSDEYVKGPKESTVLIYAVATNSLGVNLVQDKNEMLIAAESIDLNKNNVLIFETRFEKYYDYSSTPIIDLIRLAKVGENEYDWVVEKEFNDGIASLDPNRMTEVIDYVITNYKADTYGLVFWSHSTATNPYFPASRSVAEKEAEDLPEAYSFGEDRLHSNGDDFYQMNVEDLAAAVPSGVFNYIWFDSCYMSNLETIYELRGKCDYFIGSPTEDPAPGMPYHYTLPYLASKTPDVTEAAKRFFSYYNEEYSNVPATIAVIDMSKFDLLSQYCRAVYSDYSVAPSVSNFLMYTNRATPSFGPFYDLGDYTKAIGALNGLEIGDDEWQEFLDEFILYKAATAYDYNGHRIEQEKYSGISTYIYRPGDNTEKEKYFESLGWYQDVFPVYDEDEL